MLYEIKLRVRSPWLGEIRRGKDRIRRFQRGSSQDIIAFDLPRLQWTFQQACDALRLGHVDTRTIRMDEGFRSPSLQSYRRRYKSGEGRKPQEDFFEAVGTGTVLTMPVLVTSSMPGALDTQIPPTKGELNQIFKMVGTFVGMSPWGSHFGYGRFDVESLEEK